MRSSNLAVIRPYEPRLTIALGSRLKGRDCKILKNRSGYWESLLSDVFSSQVQSFTRTQYLAMTDDEQDAIKKDLPYFVGGPTNGLREKGYLEARSFITIDIDSGPVGVVDVVKENLEKLGITALIHSTLNHSEAAPRIRIIIPLRSETDPDDYGRVSRILTSRIVPGLEGVDVRSFLASQVMLLPVHCIDDDPVWIVTSGEFYDAVQELEDWQGEIPQTPSERSVPARFTPTGSSKDSKGTGVIGAFCQAYTCHGAIEQFVPGVYEPAKNGRLRRVGSKCMDGGLVFLENDTVYSFHSDADPLARPGDDGKVHAHNAFDVVRIHRGETASEAAKWAVTLPKVQAILKEQALSVIPRYPEGQEPLDADDGDDWRRCLDVHPKSHLPLSSLKNVALILRNLFRNCIAKNLLDGKLYVRKEFLGIKAGRSLSNDDSVFIRHHFEAEMKLSEIKQKNLEDAILLAGSDAEFHPIREYLDGLVWDGKKRLDSWTQLFGAKQTIYVQEAGSLTLIAAVARVFEPGMKFDSVLVIVTPQGAGKGRLLKALGGRWYGELSSDFHDANKMIESTQGKWIVEMAELRGVGKADRNMLKSYITRTNDAGRLAYGHGSEDRPRQFVVIGSSNESDFLADETGERRWWTVEGNKSADNPIEVPTRAEVDQLWAEAVVEYRRMRAEKPHDDLFLCLSTPARKEHAAVVEGFKALTEVDLLAQQISEWIDDFALARNEFTQAELWKGIGGKLIPTRAESTRLGNAMKRFESEWTGRRETRNGQKITVYRRTLTGAASGLVGT